MEPITILASVLGSIKSAVDITKSIEITDKKKSNEEVKLAVAHLMGALADAKLHWLISKALFQKRIRKFCAGERRIKRRVILLSFVMPISKLVKMVSPSGMLIVSPAEKLMAF